MPTFTPVYALPNPPCPNPHGPVRSAPWPDATEPLLHGRGGYSRGRPRLIKMQRYTSDPTWTATVTGTNVQIMTTGSVNYVAGPYLPS